MNRAKRACSVKALELTPLYARIKSTEGRSGAPAIDPAILVALWLWATIDGVGSARELERLCERDDAYRWICGGVGLNYHSLADFRTEHEAWLDAQLTRSIAALVDRKLVTLNVVAQDGLRVTRGGQGLELSAPRQVRRAAHAGQGAGPGAEEGSGRGRGRQFAAQASRRAARRA